MSILFPDNVYRPFQNKKFIPYFNKCLTKLSDIIVEDYKISDTIQERSSNIYPYISTLKRVETNDKDNFLKYWDSQVINTHFGKNKKEYTNTESLIQGNSINYHDSAVEFYGSRDLFNTMKMVSILKNTDKYPTFSIFSFGLERATKQYPFFDYYPYKPYIDKLENYIPDIMKKIDIIKYKRFKKCKRVILDNDTYMIATNMPYRIYSRIPYIDRAFAYNMDENYISIYRPRVNVDEYINGIEEDINNGITRPVFIRSGGNHVKYVIGNGYHNIFFALYFKLPCIPVILLQTKDPWELRLPWFNDNNIYDGLAEDIDKLFQTGECNGASF